MTWPGGQSLSKEQRGYGRFMRKAKMNKDLQAVSNISLKYIGVIAEKLSVNYSQHHADYKENTKIDLVHMSKPGPG